MTSDYQTLLTARRLAAGVARASMSNAFANALATGRQDDSPAIQAIVAALNEAREGAKSND